MTLTRCSFKPFTRLQYRHLSLGASLVRSAAVTERQDSDLPFMPTIPEEHFYRNRVLETYVQQKATPVTIRQLISYQRHKNIKNVLTSANYVRTELPIRLAHRIRAFQHLPFIVGTNPYLQAVYSMYWDAFERLRKISPITTLQENKAFCEIIHGTLEDHRVVIPRLAIGVSECMDHLPFERLDMFMNSLLRSRISRRVLAEQHLVLSEYTPADKSSLHNTFIFSHCSAQDTVHQCNQLAQDYIRSLYHKGKDWRAPEIVVLGETEDIQFSYVAEQIQYIVYQLLSNALRHTVLSHNTNTNTKDYPPVQVTLCSNATDVFFRISDRGGGMPGEVYRSLWSYGIRRQIFKNFRHAPYHSASVSDQTTMPLGIGLPMSKVYAEYWGGEISVVTMEGWGTDSYVRIPKLGTQNENIDVEQSDENAVVDSAVEGPAPRRLVL
ncbi:branched-chain alpha-ketoacid dehydrogenase kinase [Spinellus fusiger]|nr:branched-chain alpha-ketoacid dehydrogenase kinase [Spinellus fusiger]